MVLGQTMAEHGAAVIEDDRVGLAVSRTQHTTDHLPEQTQLPGRSCQDAAADRRAVPALDQHRAIRDDLGLAGCQPHKDRLALSRRCLPVEMFGADTELLELVADMDAVLNADSEAHGSTTLAVLQPMFDDVTDQCIGI